MNSLDEMRKNLESIQKQLDTIESRENKKAEFESKMSDLVKNFYVDTGLKIGIIKPGYTFETFYTSWKESGRKRKMFDALSDINIDIDYF